MIMRREEAIIGEWRLLSGIVKASAIYFHGHNCFYHATPGFYYSSLRPYEVACFSRKINIFYIIPITISHSHSGRYQTDIEALASFFSAIL